VSVVIVRGDAAHLPLEDGSVDLICTSPPYFGLRSYTDAGEVYDGQIGSEYTPQQYLGALWKCTAEWMRVLKPGGSIFVNLGDKYSTYTGANWGNGRSLDGYRGQRKVPNGGPVNAPGVYGIPYKSLMGLPWRYILGCIGNGSELNSAEVVKLLLRDVALGVCTLGMAEQIVDELAATPALGLGLTLRAEIIWAKPNGMPESTTDRVRRSHEQVFHLVKKARGYFAAVDEIRETAASDKHTLTRRDRTDRRLAAANGGQTSAVNPLGRLPGSVWEISSVPLTAPDWLGIDHFAAYPPELCRRIILGWSPSGICTVCGGGRVPVTDRTPMRWRESPTMAGRRGDRSFRPASGTMLAPAETRITGYACACPDASAPTTPAVVVDPFGGTGTTALVADLYGRTGITVDRSADYCRLAGWRTADPGERARVLGLPKPAPEPVGQDTLFGPEDWIESSGGVA